jgi:phage-related protein
MLSLGHSLRATLAVAALGAASLGCVDGDKLVARVRNNAIRTRIDEVELGSYKVTLPRNFPTGEMTEVEVRLYGETLRYKINEIEDELKQKAPVFEDHTLKVLRETTRQELADPDLTRLRARLLESMNATLTGAPLTALGFYEVRFLRH